MKNSFLYRLAELIYNNEKDNISNFTFVFPNRRAGLFFQKYLSDIISKPLFSPEILTINECFLSAGSYIPTDKLSNLFRIFKIYKNISNTQETFDSFVFWGEMLLSDFEEVDKYLVDANQLFKNVTELAEIEQQFSSLTESQIEAIRQFWKNFIPETEKSTKLNFLSTWKVLAELYTTFRNELMQNGFATEGMICRDVVERLKKNEDILGWENKNFVFVGFNALNPCEKNLMLELQKRNKADFYWDYEALFLQENDNPASMYYAENTHIFKSKFELEMMDFKLSEKQIQLVGVPSAVGMTKFVYSELLNYNLPTQLQDEWLRTAVVLADEKLLLPLLYSFPENVDKINVTMGFPLNSTPVSGLIMLLFELHKRKRVSEENLLFYHKNISDIINHQYISQLCKSDVNSVSNDMLMYNRIYVNKNDLQLNAIFQQIFCPVNSAIDMLDYLIKILVLLEKEWRKLVTDKNEYQLERDFIIQFKMMLTRLDAILKANTDVVDISFETLGRIIQQLIAGETIPFVGEPLDGLQVMGMLESRGLDFEHLIITSFNEGVFPKKTVSNSFIPYNLRRGFDLPTYEKQDAINSYNFYRLIHRAKKVSFVYDSRTEGVQSAEVSRYIHQLNYLYGLNIKKEELNFDISVGSVDPISVVKTPDILLKLNRFSSSQDDKRYLSASSIKTYIDCPLQFYFQKIEQLNEIDEVVESIEDNMFGSLFHAVMEYIYQPYLGQLINKELLQQISSSELLIDKYIRKAFGELFFKNSKKEYPELDGNHLLIAKVLRKYILKVLNYDMQYVPFTILETERSCKMNIETKYGNVNITGIIDRVDEKNDKIRILDYKTGSGNLDFNNWDEVFDPENTNRPKYVLQTFLYGLLYIDETKIQNKKIEPGIIYLREIFKDNFKTQIFDKSIKNSIEDIGEYKDEFVQYLTNCIEQIFDNKLPFCQTSNRKTCEYCSFKSICKR